LATDPFYISHRGGSARWPECSLHAYTQSAFWGVPALELPVGRTSDGVLIGLHDETFDRTSGTTGASVAAMTWAQVQALDISPPAGFTGQPDQPYARIDEIFNAYAGSHVIFVDPKFLTTAQRLELLDVMDDFGGPDRFVWKFYGVSTTYAPAATARGYETWGYFYDSDAQEIAGWSDHAQWSILGLNYNASAQNWTDFLTLAAGRPVIGHICPDAAAVATAITRGADGLMVSGVTAAISRST
jgi:hypothetical protein